MKRAYRKKSPYWEKFSAKGEASNTIQSTTPRILDATQWSPSLVGGEGFYTEVAKAAARSSTAGGTSTGLSEKGTKNNYLNLNNIAAGLLPFSETSQGIDVKDAILLCQKAYANIAVIRNAIDVSAEFANADIYLEGGNARSRKFYEKWFKRIKLDSIKEQFCREWFKSGNIFFYRIDGALDLEGIRTISSISDKGVAKPKIPITYILLNPYEIAKDSAAAFASPLYKKALSKFELERLRNPKDEHDKALLESLPPETQKMVKAGQFMNDGIYMYLKGEFLHTVFYKKQDYEPFAIPFAYPVLFDVNAKIELKNIDQAIARTVQNVMLLITMGTEPDKGGINPANMKAMQTIFEKDSVGRVLVSDWTTKAEFVVPDISKVITAEKFIILNQDIKDGLMNVFLGDDKYNGADVKIAYFLERMTEPREAFLNYFLQSEMERVGKDMGFKDIPKAKFKEIDLKDELEYTKVVTRLAELSILTPEQAIKTLKTGTLPEAEDMDGAQKKFVESRKSGHYNPITGGVPINEEGLPQSVDEKLSAPVKKPSGSAGRPVGAKSAANMYSGKDIQSTVYAIDAFMQAAEDASKRRHGLKKLNKAQKESVTELCKLIVSSARKEDWTTKLNECMTDSAAIASLKIMDEVTAEANEHQLDDYSAAILYHSTVK